MRWESWATATAIPSHPLSNSYGRILLATLKTSPSSRFASDQAARSFPNCRETTEFNIRITNRTSAKLTRIPATTAPWYDSPEWFTDPNPLAIPISHAELPSAWSNNQSHENIREFTSALRCRLNLFGEARRVRLQIRSFSPSGRVAILPSISLPTRTHFGVHIQTPPAAFLQWLPQVEASQRPAAISAASCFHRRQAPTYLLVEGEINFSSTHTHPPDSSFSH